MRLSEFDYILPKELIAQHPLLERDNARLLVLNRKKRTIEHRVFGDIADYLDKNDLIVLNDTKVLPARLHGHRLSTGRAEILLLSRKRGLIFNSMVKPSRIKVGEKIIFDEKAGISGEISARNEITFKARGGIEAVYKLGVMPLPPYIKRAPQELDNEYYQTVYAKNEGAIASPTAGLHFTRGLMERMKSSGINFAHITLHVGAGTFRPVKVDDVTRHKMEAEYFKIPQEAIRLIKKTRKARARIFAVGTTSLRALESYCLRRGSRGYTDLFIYPGYKFKMADCLLTNFHLPRTTLFMLACAFAGGQLIKKAYQEAIAKKYRFYSYGDAMLII